MIPPYKSATEKKAGSIRISQHPIAVRPINLLCLREHLISYTKFIEDKHKIDMKLTSSSR